MNPFRFYVRKAHLLVAGWEEQRRLLRRFPDLSLSPAATVVSPARLDVGENVIIQGGSVIHCGGLAWSGGAGHIRIGADSIIAHHCVLLGAGGIEIGQRSACGPGCMIFSSRSLHGGDARKRASRPHGGEAPGGEGDTHLFAPVTIGEDVSVFAGCVIGPGVNIGDGAAVGAGSVVLEDVAPRTLVAGMPARKIRELD